MSHPNPSHDRENEYPEDKVTHYPKKKKEVSHVELYHRSKKAGVNYTGTHEHAHHKGGMMGALKGLMHAKHFGAKHGARHEAAKSKALKKKRGESTMPF